jgi:hypothetical protein
VVVFAIFAVWAERQALDTDDWVKTSGRLLENKDIQSALANFAVDELYANVNVEKELHKALPKNFKPLSGPASSGLRELAVEGGKEALGTGRFQSAWKDANRAAHEQLIDVIEDRGRIASTEGGQVDLELRPLIIEVADQVGIGGNLAQKLPEDVGNLRILKSDQLGLAQTIARVIRGLALVSSLLVLALYALAIYLSRGYRWITMLAVGTGLILAGIVVLILRDVTGDVVVNELASQSAQPAGDATWSIGTSLLASIARGVIIYGFFFVLAAWLASPHRSSVAARRTLAPVLRDYPIAVGAVLGLIALIWILTGIGSTRPLLTRLVLVAMAAAGLVALRNRALLEAPDATLSDWPERIRTRAVAIWRSRGRRGAPPPEPEDRRLERLDRLAALHERGALSDEEFEAEKAAIRGTGPRAPGG